MCFSLSLPPAHQGHFPGFLPEVPWGLAYFGCLGKHLKLRWGNFEFLHKFCPCSLWGKQHPNVPNRQNKPNAGVVSSPSARPGLLQFHLSGVEILNPEKENKECFLTTDGYGIKAYINKIHFSVNKINR